MYVLINPTEGILLQYLCLSNHHNMLFYNFISYTSIKLNLKGKKTPKYFSITKRYFFTLNSKIFTFYEDLKN